MSESALKTKSLPRAIRASYDWGPGPDEIVVGKDVLGRPPGYMIMEKFRT